MGHHYCTLWLRADSADAAQTVFLPKVQDTEEFDPMAHVSWLLAQVQPGICLGRLPGMETLLSFFWGGPGRGGGPFISTALAALLVQQHIALDFGFYVES